MCVWCTSRREGVRMCVGGGGLPLTRASAWPLVLCMPPLLDLCTSLWAPKIFSWYILCTQESFNDSRCSHGSSSCFRSSSTAASALSERYLRTYGLYSGESALRNTTTLGSSKESHIPFNNSCRFCPRYWQYLLYVSVKASSVHVPNRSVVSIWIFWRALLSAKVTNPAFENVYLVTHSIDANITPLARQPASSMIPFMAYEFTSKRFVS